VISIVGQDQTKLTVSPKSMSFKRVEGSRIEQPGVEAGTKPQDEVGVELWAWTVGSKVGIKVEVARKARILGRNILAGEQ
jgi:hypothetical protein